MLQIIEENKVIEQDKIKDLEITQRLVYRGVECLCEKASILVKTLIFMQMDLTGVAFLDGKLESGKTLIEATNWILLNQMDNTNELISLMKSAP